MNNKNFKLELSKLTTKLALQRTYLSYMRTGFAIASIAGVFKKIYLVYFGLIMIILSTIQYYLFIKNIEQTKIEFNKMHYLPLIYVILSIIILFLQFYK